MATAEPLPSFVVLNNNVRDYNRIRDRGEQKWATVKCESKHAYMYAEYGQSVVEGLTLLVRLAAGDLYYDLSISASENALTLLGAEVPEDIAEYDGRKLSLSSHVENVVDEKNLIVFAVSFSTSGEFRDFSLDYYLVYDSSAASLSMICCSPTHCPPLPVRCGDGTGSDDLLMASLYQRPDVLCLWSPLLLSGTGGDPWQTRDRRFPENYPPDFRVDTAFSFKGKAFWADLARGVLYCDCSALLANPVDFRFIELPQGCRLDYLQILEMGPMKMFRTMGSVGDCIWFVSVDQSKLVAGNTLVKVWTLDLSMEEWNMYNEFRLGNLWKLEDFKKAKLRKVVPQWPILREQDDGVLYFLLPKRPPLTMNHVSKGHNYICGVDMRRNASLLLSRPLSVSCIMMEPIILPHNFFEHLDPVPPRKRKVLAV